jgi:regulator of protease activity HflC (stomatin/prohibitin superfamily)
LKDCDSVLVREYERTDGTRFGKVVRAGNAADPDSLAGTPGLLLLMPGVKDIREYVVPVSELLPPDEAEVKQ